MAQKLTYDTTNKLIKINDGITEIDIQIDLYSDGKEDWLVSEELAKFEFPYRVVGGDPLTSEKSITPVYFLKDPWRIKPYEGDHELLLVGNLYSDETPPSGLVVSTSGAYTVNVIINRSFDAITTVVETDSGHASSSGTCPPMVANFIR